MTAMRIEPVPDDDHVAAQVSQQTAKELDDFGLAYVGIDMPSQEEPDTPPNGRDRQGTDHGHLLVRSCAVTQDRRLALGRPGPMDGREHEEAGFVDEDDMGAVTRRFFLCAASPS